MMTSTAVAKIAQTTPATASAPASGPGFTP